MSIVMDEISLPLGPYTQVNRPLAVTTPLGPDVLLLVAFRGHEQLSRPFRYELDLVAPNHVPIPFERLIGQGMTVALRRPRAGVRFFHGRVSRFSQGNNDREFTHYQAELVPDLWLLTKRRRSRIAQHLSIPDILRQVLAGLNVSYQIQGQFQPRDFCVQYRESDFDFASRLMEEEGIYYFFTHSERGHQLVLANTPQSHPEVPGLPGVPFCHGRREEWQGECITSWRKVQELRSGKCELWDHSFELPGMHLDAQRPIQDDVAVGRVNHKLAAGLNGTLEVYDYPGGYAQRFDGIDRGGGEQPQELQKIFTDNQRTVDIRMQEEATGGLSIHGAANCGSFLPGHKFTLTGHGHGDGVYVLTHVEHSARQTGYGSAAADEPFRYDNTFTCIPLALPFRPARQTPRPTIHGTQTATVVGFEGQEIFVDKYGRVKVQFHWHREGQSDADSSCWVRVAQAWAGKKYGAYFWPRVGNEVVVAFEEGDPDRPIILGSVYNAENLAPYVQNEKNVSGFATRSTPGGGPSEFNQLHFDDTKGEELVHLRAQKNFSRKVLHDDLLIVGNSQTIEIENGRKTTIKQGGEQTTVENGDVIKDYKGNYQVTAKKNVQLNAGEQLAISNDTGALVCLYQDGRVILQSEVKVILCAPEVEITADAKILLDAPEVEFTGWLHGPMVQANLVMGVNYTPGAGNVM